MARLTFIHVVLSLVSLGSGLLQSSAFFAGHRTPRLNGIFLIIAAGMSVSVGELSSDCRQVFRE
jgi:hypothetical protein